MRHNRTHYAIVAAGSALLLLASGVLAVGRPDERVRACGGADGVNAHRVAFEISQASDVWKYISVMGRAPELELDPAPAYVVVFGDGYIPRNVSGNGRRPAILDGVVCVVQADGRLNLYFDVDLNGLQAPAG